MFQQWHIKEKSDFSFALVFYEYEGGMGAVGAASIVRLPFELLTCSPTDIVH